MITARDYESTPVLDSPNPSKPQILKVMKSGTEDGLGAGYVRNFKTGSVDKRFFDDAFVSDCLFWRTEDTYNFEFNDMELSPEFCARVMELIRQG